MRILLISFLLLLFARAHASEYVWAGKKNASFTQASSWTVNGRPANTIPAKNDDLIFTAGSQNLFFTFDHDATIRNFIVDENVELVIQTSHPVTLTIQGNLDLRSRIKIKGKINLVFDTEEKNAFIRSSATQFNGNVLFDGREKIKITDDFQTAGTIELKDQELIIESKFIACDVFHITSTKTNNTQFKTSTVIASNIRGDKNRLQQNDFDALIGNTGLGSPGTPKTLCGAGIPFTITAVATTNYNGFDVSCNDSSDATICVNVIGGVGPFTYSWVGGPATACYTDVDAGTYLVVVFDNGQGGFSCFTTVTVDEPPAITLLSWTGSNPSCNGVCDGTAIPIIIGGVTPYSYSWSSGETTPVATMLCNGTNTVTVTDNNGCVFDTTFFILIPTPVLPNVTVIDASCFGVCDGSASSAPSGGNGAPYTWSWSTGSSNDSISGLCVGTYSVDVLDNNGCPGSASFTVNEPVSMVVTVVSQTNLVCSDVCSGSITISVSNGTPPYSLQWYNATTGLPIPLQTFTTISGLCAGDYYVEVTDQGGCQFQSINFTITSPPPISITVSGTNLACNGVCTGTLSAGISGGTPTYSVTWFNAVTSLPVGTGNPLTGVCAGTYFAQVTDGNGCIDLSGLITLTEPPPLVISATTTDILCFGACTGTATATFSGGTGGLSVEWYTSPGGVSYSVANPVTNLCQGDYIGTVTDANGCTLSTPPFTITEPNELLVTSEGSTNVVCNGSCDGTAFLNTTGGTAPVVVDWYSDPGAVPTGLTGDTISTLCPGTYFGIATDSNGCSVTGSMQIITEPLPMVITVTPSSSQCGTICNGSASAAVSGGTAPYSFTWVNATTGAVLADTTNPITNLCAGDYYLIVTDANGCSDTSAIFTITSTVVVTGSIVATDVTCNGTCNGYADLTPSGGTTPYVFVWYDQVTGLPIGQSTEDANGLCAGDYFVIATDSSGCNSLPVNVTINEPPAISITVTPASNVCSGACSGQITATVTGGTPVYSLNWFNATTGIAIGQTGLTATGLCEGSYFLQVTDAAGCVINSNTVTITDPVPINASISTTNVSCFGACNGTAALTITGGLAPFTVTWSTSANTTTNETNICAGTFTYTVTDANGCVVGPVNFTITQPPNITPNVTNGTTSCNGSCDGIVSVNVAGGTSPYTYSWTGGATTPVVSGLCVGAYNVTVTDAAGCAYGPFTANVTSPGAISVTAVTTPANCSGGCNGTATATITGGTAPINIAWSDPLAQTTTTAIQLCAGTYSVIVTDAGGCDDTATVTVTSTGSPTVAIASTNASCNGNCDGTATATPAGGTAPLSVAWDNGATTNAITGLCPDIYVVTVTDAAGCTATGSVTITDPSNMTATISTVVTPCSVCSGSATVTPSGGAGGYTFLWSPSAGSAVTPTVNSLCAGIYTVTVTDASGCQQVFTAAISNTSAEVITVDSTNATCNNVCNGTATVNFVCSDPPCTIAWNDPAAQTTSTATGLCAGTYGVTVTNNSGCISAATIDIIDPTPIDANVTAIDALCNGVCTGQAVSNPTGGNGAYTYLWNDPAAQTAFTAFNLCPGTVTVIVTDSVGCTDTASVVISEPTAMTFTTNANNVSCFGACNGSATAFPTGGVAPFTYAWDDPSTQTTQSATSLCAGTFNVTVFDGNGCTSGPTSVTITEPNTGMVSISSTNPFCSGQCNGTATANVTGGTGPFAYSWNDPLNQTTATATNLCPGTYTVTVTDVNGCTLGSATITITNPSPVGVSITIADVSCNGLCNGVANAVITGGSAPYTTIWDDPAAQNTAIASALCPGTYTVQVADANGCPASAVGTVAQPAVISAGLVVNDVLCNGTCNGSASVTPAGGTGAISILWSPFGQTTASISGLCPDNYSVSLTDANGCNVITNLAINEPPAFALATGSSPATCGLCDGAASVSPVGGTPPYTTLWSASAASQTTLTALNLCANIYSVTVTDQNGCALTTNVAVSNTNAETVTVSTVDASCPDICDGSATATTACVNGPCSFAWFSVLTGANLGVSTNTINSLCPGNYYVRVINSINCTTFVDFTIGGPDTLDITETITDLTCNGVCTGAITVSATGGTGAISFQWDAAAGGGTTNTVTNLCAGTYSLIVTDAIGCDDTVSYTVAQPFTLSVNVNATSALCSGTCTGIATAFVTGGTPGYTYLWDDPGAQTTASALGLCGGLYSVTVTDNAGCSATSAAASITDPVILNATVASTDATCAGSCDGTATVTVTGGTSPIAIQWDDPLSQITATAVGLCANTFNVVVVDSNNCSVGPLPITVNNPPAFTAIPVVTSVLCNGLCNGSITINTAGGTGSFLFSIDGGLSFQTSNTFTNLCPGAYDILVQDGTGCSSSPVSVNVNEPTVLDATTAHLDADCLASNGAATVNPFGGTPGYTVVWSDFTLVPIGQTTLTAINLTAGIYTATITDANGCQTQQSVLVGNFPAPSATGVLTSPVCNGDCNGQVDITTTGGVAPYTYVWYPNGQTTEDIVNVCAGLQTVQITDALGCIAFDVFDLTEPAPFVSNVTVTDATCGQLNGSATAIVTGGTGALSLTWSNLQTGSTATGLAGGAYSVLVTDALGCNDQFNVLVNNTSGPTPVVNVTNPTCFNSCTGTATVSAIGGTAPYSYLWVSNGSTATTQNNLCPGTIIVEVQDSLGCIGIANVTVTSSPQMNDSILVVPASCGICDGVAVVYASGLTPFTYQWSALAGSATTSSVNSQCMGLYTVVVTDAAGCSDTALAMIPNVNAPTATITTTGISCYGMCNATASATGTGGTAPLIFNWFDQMVIPVAANTTNVGSLCEGDYVVQVMDAAGCASFMPFTIDEPDSLVASINFTMDESCFNTCDGAMSAMPINGTLPFTYAWGPPPGVTTSTATNLCDGIYTVTVTDAGGCSLTLTDSVSQPPPIIMALDSTDASCSTVPDGAVDATVTGGAGGFTYSWVGPNGFTATSEDLSAIYYGTYILTATDANGCSLTDTIVVNALLIAIADAGGDTVLCNIGGGATIVGIGSTPANYSWTDTAGNVLSTSITLNAPVTSGTADYIFIVDNAGCIDKDTITVTVNPLPLADAGPDYEILAGQTVNIGGNPTTASGNAVNWVPSNYLDDGSTYNPNATPDSTAYFILLVTDPNGCVNTDTMMIEVLPSIIFPNGFSPNSDGANDTWILDFIELFPDCEVSVYNRWGQPVFYSKGYDIPWDGTYDGKPVTVGTYYYVILLNHPLYPDAFTGPLTILR